MVPFADPRATFSAHREVILAAMTAVLDSGQYILGPEVEKFEAAFASYTGTAHCVGVGNGTDAIELALRALDMAGRAVFTVSHTAVATVAAIERAGAVPVLVDVDPHTRCMCPVSLAEALDSVRSHRQLVPGAVIPVHLYGHPAPLDDILTVAKDLPVIEDCAQAHGAQYKGRMVGSLGRLSTFSFYPTKNLGAAGDAGAVCTNDPVLAERLKSLRQYGWQERYISAEPGVNTRLDPMQAAVLSVLLPHLPNAVRERQAMAAEYNAAFAGTRLTLPETAPWAEPAWHLYVVQCPDAGLSANHAEGQRNACLNFLREHGVGASLHYPAAVHSQPAYASRVHSGQVILAPGGLPVTERLCRTLLTLPLYPFMGDARRMQVREAVLAWNESVTAL